MNALANNASHLAGQSRFDHAEDYRIAEEYRQDALDAEIERIWLDPADLQGALEYHGINLSSEACAGLSGAVEHPGGVPGYVLALIDDLDPLVRQYVEEVA